MDYPCLKINLYRLGNNCRLINNRCTSLGISVVGVLKCMLGDIKAAEIFKKNGINIFGDSRIENLQKLHDHFGSDQELMLLRTPMISEIDRVLRFSTVSMNTQKETVKALSDAAGRLGVKHKIIIMVETDDRREGLLPEEVLPFCRYIIKNCPNIIIWGLGTNARCISDKKPQYDSIALLLSLKNQIEKEIQVNIAVVSGGNSSIWRLLENNHMPAGVNQVRIGEAILLGHDTVEYKNIEGLYTDVFILEAEVIEVKHANNKITKLIAALGIQDTGVSNITCTSRYLAISDQSSDHTVLQFDKADKFSQSEVNGGITSKIESSVHNLKTNGYGIKAKGNNTEDYYYKAGDIITFRLNYFGLLAAMTSPFVKKLYIIEK